MIKGYLSIQGFIYSLVCELDLWFGVFVLNINELIMNQINFTDSQQIDAIFQEGVDKAIAKHKERGESIAVLNKNDKVIIFVAKDIDRFQLQKIQK
ncbi:MAG: hypothetical protein RLZZ535_3316 [Cyanobacteriota bacterium]